MSLHRPLRAYRLSGRSEAPTSVPGAHDAALSSVCLKIKIDEASHRIASAPLLLVSRRLSGADNGGVSYARLDSWSPRLGVFVFRFDLLCAPDFSLGRHVNTLWGSTCALERWTNSRTAATRSMTVYGRATLHLSTGMTTRTHGGASAPLSLKPVWRPTCVGACDISWLTHELGRLHVYADPRRHAGLALSYSRLLCAARSSCASSRTRAGRLSEQRNLQVLSGRSASVAHTTRGTRQY